MVTTFLIGCKDKLDPLSLIKNTAEILDSKRLLSQLNESLMIINNPTKNNPAYKDWLGCIEFLKLYYNGLREEWLSRGNKYSNSSFVVKEYVVPWWFLWNQLIENRMMILLRKDRNHYSKYFDIPDNQYSYIYPSKHEQYKDIVIQNNMVIIDPSKICEPLKWFNLVKDKDIKTWLDSDRSMRPDGSRKISKTDTKELLKIARQRGILYI